MHPSTVYVRGTIHMAIVSVASGVLKITIYGWLTRVVSVEIKGVKGEQTATGPTDECFHIY